MLTLELTEVEADAVRAALVNRADEMTRRADKTEHGAVFDDYMLEAATCDAVVDKLNEAEEVSDG